MGIYYSIYPNACPYCGEKSVGGTFVSAPSMNFSIGCGSCGANDFSEEEITSLGDPLPATMDGQPIILPNVEQENGHPELD